MKEFVRNGAEQVASARANRVAPRHHRAVAMLHRIDGGVGQVVRDERIVPRFVFGILTEYRAFLTDDSFNVLHEIVDLSGTLRVMYREPEFALADGEVPDQQGTELDRTVHQILQVRRGEFERHRTRME